MASEQTERELFDFHLEVVEQDQSGYYYARWERAVPLTVRAANREAAFEKALAVMGECPRGRTWAWVVRIKSIEEAAS